MKNNPPTPGQPNAPADWEAIARYLAGESSPAESEQVARWLEEHTGDAELVDALDKAIASLTFRDQSDVDVEGALRQVAARRDSLIDSPRPFARPSTQRVQFRKTTIFPWRAVTLLAAAAVIILAARALLERKSGATTLPSVVPG